jgi:hypothetical protein
MAFLDFINNRNASQQASVAQPTQPETQPSRSVESLPAHVKAEAVEAARPAAELMNQATTPKNIPAQPQVPNDVGRGRSVGRER